MQRCHLLAKRQLDWYTPQFPRSKIPNVTDFDNLSFRGSGTAPYKMKVGCLPAPGGKGLWRKIDKRI